MIKNLLLLRIDERMNHGQVMISYMKNIRRNIFSVLTTLRLQIHFFPVLSK